MMSSDVDESLGSNDHHQLFLIRLGRRVVLTPPGRPRKTGCGRRRERLPRCIRLVLGATGPRIQPRSTPASTVSEAMERVDEGGSRSFVHQTNCRTQKQIRPFDPGNSASERRPLHVDRCPNIVSPRSAAVYLYLATLNSIV